MSLAGKFTLFLQLKVYITILDKCLAELIRIVYNLQSKISTWSQRFFPEKNPLIFQLNHRFTDITSSLLQILSAAKRSFSFARKNPFSTIVTLLYQSVLTDALTQSRNITCPSASDVQAQVNTNLANGSCKYGAKSTIKFKINRNPIENFEVLFIVTRIN